MESDNKLNVLPIVTKKEIKPFSKQNENKWKIVTDNAFSNQDNGLMPDIVYKYLKLKAKDLIVELKSHAKKTCQYIEEVMKNVIFI